MRNPTSLSRTPLLCDLHTPRRGSTNAMLISSSLYRCICLRCLSPSMAGHNLPVPRISTSFIEKRCYFAQYRQKRMSRVVVRGSLSPTEVASQLSVADFRYCFRVAMMPSRWQYRLRLITALCDDHRCLLDGLRHAAQLVFDTSSLLTGSPFC